MHKQPGILQGCIVLFHNDGTQRNNTPCSLLKYMDVCVCVKCFAVIKSARRPGPKRQTPGMREEFPVWCPTMHPSSQRYNLVNNAIFSILITGYRREVRVYRSIKELAMSLPLNITRSYPWYCGLFL